MEHRCEEKWCPGADSNHRHADFQSAGLLAETTGFPTGYLQLQHSGHSTVTMECKMATIRKHRSKWQAIVRRKGVGSKSKTFNIKRDAQRWAREQELKLDNGTFGKLMPDEQSLAQLLRTYRDKVTSKKKGAPQEIRRIRRLLKDPISNLKISHLTSYKLSLFRDRRLHDGPRAAALDLIIISHCISIAIKEWGLALDENPTINVKRPAPPKARQRRLEDGEYELLYEASSQTRNPYIWPLIELAIETGMRRSELLALTWDNIDLLNMTAFLSDTKNGTSRTVPLTSKAVAIIKGIPKTHERLFLLSENASRLAWDKLRKRARLDDFRFHDLRHEAISRFFEKGLSVAEVALISGHKDPRMLMRYTHLKAEDIAKKLG